jgi:hypothetical protein
MGNAMLAKFNVNPHFFLPMEDPVPIYSTLRPKPENQIPCVLPASLSCPKSSFEDKNNQKVDRKCDDER